MKITSALDSPLFKNPHNVKAALLYDTDDALVIHLDIDPGQSLKRHITPVDVFFYVLEGTPEIEIGDERIAVEKDHLVESPAGIVHCIHNPSEKRARVLVAKVPKPKKSTKIL